MNFKRVISLLAILVLILSLTPAISAQVSIAEKVTGYFSNLQKNTKYLKTVLKIIETGNNIVEVLIDQGIIGNSDDQVPSFLYEYGFLVPLSLVVGGVKQQVKARIAINSRVTWIESCGDPPSDPRKCVRYPNNSSPAAALYIFAPNTSYQTNFLWFQYSNPGVNNQNSTGVLSFSRKKTNTYSIVNHFHHYRGFSYYISSRSDSSSITFDLKPSTIFNLTEFQAVPLLQNPGYENLYYVPAPQIYIGSQLLQINPIVDFNNGVIIDSTIPYIMLATKVYSELMTQLQSKIGRLSLYPDGNGTMCSNSMPNWPDLPLKFQWGSSQMVLRKDNYVITDSQTGQQCAAIYPSQKVSVIGIIAQLDRKMIFDVERSMLYFDKDPQLNLISTNSRRDNLSQANHCSRFDHACSVSFSFCLSLSVLCIFPFFFL